MTTLEIKTAKFEPQEIKAILKKRNIIMGDTWNLNHYNEASYFRIKQFLEDGNLVGYGVIFLGYNGIESNDVSIADIAYFGDTSQLFKFLNMFSKELIESKDLPFKVNNVYFDSEAYIEEINITFERFGFQKVGRTR